MLNYEGLYNKNYYGDKLNEKHFLTQKPNFRIIENGTILPHKPLTVNGKWTWGFGGIVDGIGKYIKNSFVYTGWGGVTQQMKIFCTVLQQ